MKARVAIARRMLEWVWEMLDSGTEYRTQDKEFVKREVPENKAHRRIPGLGSAMGGTGRRGGVSPPLHKRGAAQRPLSPPQACQNTILAAAVPARPPQASGQRDLQDTGKFPAAAGTIPTDPRAMPADTGAGAARTANPAFGPAGSGADTVKMSRIAPSTPTNL